MDRAQSKWSIPRRLSFNLLLIKIGQAGLEAAFQVPMPGDSGSSPNAGGISIKLLLDPGDLHSNPSRLLSFNKSETLLWTIAKILLLSY